MPDAGAGDDENTDKTPEYFKNMDIYVENIDKMIRVHGGNFTRQLINLILERLKYFLKRLLRYLRSIQMSRKKYYLK